jgi:hypothetical protein
MPTQARWFVKAGLIYLAVTFVAGAWLLMLEALDRPAPYVFAIEHAHLGMVGWLVNIVMGIALWMLPLNRERFPCAQGRYPGSWGVACFALLNGGLIVRIFAEPWFTLGGHAPLAAALLIVSAIAQPLAVAIFVAIAWQRVRGPRVPATSAS